MFMVATFAHGDMFTHGRYWKIDRAYGNEVIIYDAS